MVLHRPVELAALIVHVGPGTHVSAKRLSVHLGRWLYKSRGLSVNYRAPERSRGRFGPDFSAWPFNEICPRGSEETPGDCEEADYAKNQTHTRGDCRFGCDHGGGCPRVQGLSGRIQVHAARHEGDARSGEGSATR